MKPYDPIIRSQKHYATYKPTGRKQGQQPGPKPIPKQDGEKTVYLKDYLSRPL